MTAAATPSTNGTGHKERIKKGASKPPVPAVNTEAIPRELRDRPQWVPWGWEQSFLMAGLNMAYRVFSIREGG